MTTLIGFDIETYTGGFCPDGERTGLDPRYTRVTSAAVWSGTSGEYFADEAEQKLLKNLNEWFMDFPDRSATIVTWNGANFDLPFVALRAICNGVPLGLSLRDCAARPFKYRLCPGYDAGQVGSWGGLDHVDLMYSYKEYALEHDVKYSLKPVGRSLGFNPIEVDASQMELLSPEEQRAYNLSDSSLTHDIGLITDLEPWRDSAAV